MVWEWIYIQRPFVKSLIDCWAFRSSTVCKYMDVTQRKQHSHASVGTKVSDISRRRGKQPGRRRVLPAPDGCSVSKWSVCVSVSERGRRNDKTTGAWMHFAAHQMKSEWCRSSKRHRWTWWGFSLLFALPGEGWRYSSSRLPVWLLSVCWRDDGSSGSLTKLLSASWANSRFRALWGGGGNCNHDIISTVMDE